MKKLFLSLLAIHLIGGLALAQSEYRFVAIRAGFTHSLFTSQPETSPTRFAYTQDGEVPLFSISDDRLGSDKKDRPISYAPGVSAGLLYHFDFDNNDMGITIGAEYVTYRLSAQYSTKPGYYLTQDGAVELDRLTGLGDPQLLTENHRVNSFSFPIFFKIADNIYKNQRYFYAGGAYNLNMSVREVQIADWNEETSFQRDLESDEIRSGTVSLFAGFNYMIFNFQLDYMLGSVFDTEYLEDGTLPYSNREDIAGNLSFRTTINIPISEWLVLKSWKAEQIRRRFKRNY